jgi:hypothetical protein
LPDKVLNGQVGYCALNGRLFGHSNLPNLTLQVDGLQASAQSLTPRSA